MIRVFQFDDGTCMQSGDICKGTCSIGICPVRTIENAWMSTNAMYGIMGTRKNVSRLPSVSVINLIRYDKLQIKDILNTIAKSKRVYMDTDSDIREHRFETQEDKRIVGVAISIVSDCGNSLD